jgi:hypothetical protein
MINEEQLDEDPSGAESYLFVRASIDDEPHFRRTSAHIKLKISIS